MAMATFFGLPNPLNAMQIPWINILMDGPPAQSLGVEPVDQEVMTKPPRRRNGKIHTQNVFSRVLQSAAMIIINTLYIFVRDIQEGQITARDTTMKFTCFGFFDMSHADLAVITLNQFPSRDSLIRCLTSSCWDPHGTVIFIYVSFFQSLFQTEAFL
ncbi:hypothetical protein JCM33374_g2874 [Metschnikowia sp. JCM 33374]|nr:hypothetical protein JCM33374_g2874 [Metschnikowia sp. JCM 33374]